jgi:hypothetical protein
MTLRRTGSVRRLDHYVASLAAGGGGGPFSLAAAPVVAFRRMVARAVTARVSLDNKVRFIEQTPARIKPTRCAADGAFTWHWY